MKIRQLLSTYPYQSTLLVVDSIGFYLCMFFAYSLRFNYSSLQLSLPLLFFYGFTTVALYLFNSYQQEPASRALKSVIKCFLAVALAAIATMVYVYLIGRTNFIPLYGRGVLPVGFILFGIWAITVRYSLIRFGRFKVNNHWLYIGNEHGAQWLTQENNKQSHQGKLTALVYQEGKEIDAIKNELTSEKNTCQWQAIIVYDFSELPNDIQQILINKRTLGWPIYSFSEFVSKTWMKIPIFHIGKHWIMDNGGFALLNDSINIHSKKVFDLLMAIVFSIIALPIMAVVAILIRLDSKGPILFNQKRIGLHGKTFTVFKFRTMTSDADKAGAQWATKDDKRITALGKKLRKYRLDELPQVFNVLKGDMSFIGPRPEQPKFVTELEQKIPYYNLRHTVKPGITGWAQVVFHYGSTVDHAREKLEFDLYYVKSQSVMLDALIIAKTCKTILYGQGQ